MFGAIVTSVVFFSACVLRFRRPWWPRLSCPPFTRPHPGRPLSQKPPPTAPLKLSKFSNILQSKFALRNLRTRRYQIMLRWRLSPRKRIYALCITNNRGLRCLTRSREGPICLPIRSASGGCCRMGVFLIKIFWFGRMRSGLIKRRLFKPSWTISRCILRMNSLLFF